MNRGDDTPPPDARGKDVAGGSILRALEVGERTLVLIVAGALLLLSVALLIWLVSDFVLATTPFATRFLKMLDQLLLVVIVLEVYYTVRLHAEGGGFQLEPFLIIGCIAIVRHILTIVAKTVVNPEKLAESQALLVDLSVSAGVLLLIISALALARWSSRWSKER